MKELRLKESLNQIAERLTESPPLEDVYEQLSLLSDIDDSEEQVNNGEILPQKEAKGWLK